MPGDELHEEATGQTMSAPGAGRGRTGPRHAAPRKPFLTRLHVPAGKAVAMAAMPSAVLMSMGITPQLAYAKSLPKNPFGDGHCVSQQDQAEDQAEEEARQEAAAEAERKAAAQEEAERKAAQEEAASDASDSSASGSAEPSDGGASSDASGTSDPTAEPEPSTSAQEDSEEGLLTGILGGLGDSLKGDGGQSDATAEPEPEPSTTGTPSATQQTSSEEESSATGKSSDPVGDAVGKVGDTVDGITGGLTEAGSSPDEQQGAEESGAAADDAEDADAYPCVEEKKVAGTDEQTPNTLPNQPWTLKASTLSIRGQDYKGVVNVRTANGESKQVLKFTADSLDIGDLHQIVQGPDGLQYHVEAAPGSTSTIRESQVTLYTERLEGKLFGLVPIVFDAEHPPPLNLPNVYFTDVTVEQAGQFGGTLTIPGLHSTITQG
ncbi:hypothetical protein [Streptomyces sp. TR06-5]|uniref:hypothetical protein n=1 Tax=unclassified Streptomyces TaxID=2593676 RepID=UPI0039A3E9A3